MGHVNIGGGPVGQILLTFDLEIWDVLKTSVNTIRCQLAKVLKIAFKSKFQKQILMAYSSIARLVLIMSLTNFSFQCVI